MIRLSHPICLVPCPHSPEARVATLEGILCPTRLGKEDPKYLVCAEGSGLSLGPVPGATSEGVSPAPACRMATITNIAFHKPVMVLELPPCINSCGLRLHVFLLSVPSLKWMRW